MTKLIIRTINEEEIPVVAGCLCEGRWIKGERGEDLLKKLTVQFHRQKDLLLGIFDGASGSILGAIAAEGRGDTVSIVNVWATGARFYGLIKTLITAEERASRRYGYSKIFLSAEGSQRSFLMALGYKPRLLFTFSGDRQELFAIFSQLYPLWIEAGGQNVRVILGGDHLEEGVKESLKNHPVKTEYLFLKSL